jgi:cytochrome bd-type quinol oxidase subunit 2
MSNYGQYDTEKNLSKKETKISRFLSSFSSINFLIIGLAIFLIGLVVDGNINEPSIFASFCTFIACIFFFIGGVFVIIRKEAPRPGTTSIKGFVAILSGSMMVFASGCAGLIMLRLIIEYFIEK